MYSTAEVVACPCRDPCVNDPQFESMGLSVGTATADRHHAFWVPTFLRTLLASEHSIPERSVVVALLGRMDP